MQSCINKDRSSGKNQNMHAHDFIRIQYEIPLRSSKQDNPNFNLLKISFNQMENKLFSGVFCALTGHPGEEETSIIQRTGVSGESFKSKTGQQQNSGLHAAPQRSTLA